MGPEPVFLAMWTFCALFGFGFIFSLARRKRYVAMLSAAVGLVGGFLPIIAVKGPTTLETMSYLAALGGILAFLGGLWSKRIGSTSGGLILTLMFAYTWTFGQSVRYDAVLFSRLPIIVTQFSMLFAPLILMLGSYVAASAVKGGNS